MSRYIPDDNLSYPVLISIDDRSGSGFYLNTNDGSYLVTAKHVLFEENSKNEKLTLWDKTATLSSYSKDPTEKTPFVLGVNLEMAKVKAHPIFDIAIVKILTFKEETPEGTWITKPADGITQKQSGAKHLLVGVPLSSCRKYEDIQVSNEIFVFGYPNSLGIHEKSQDNNELDYSRPLLRKGIIAGKNDLKRTIIIDCPIYQGNSGGLVMECEQVNFERKFFVLGVVTKFIPFVENMKSLQYGTVNTNIENSGYGIVVPIDTILEFIQKEKQATTQPQ